MNTSNNAQSLVFPSNEFYSPVKGKTVSVFGETLCHSRQALPLARTHSSRKYLSPKHFDWRTFHRPKTVQILDRLELEKACIDAEDECFNTEWSPGTLLKNTRMNTSKHGCPAPSRSDVPTSDSGKSFIFNISDRLQPRRY